MSKELTTMKTAGYTQSTIHLAENEYNRDLITQIPDLQ